MTTSPLRKANRRSARRCVTRARSHSPHVPDHQLIKRIGRGSYGEVWLARNVMGGYRAVKVVYRNRFPEARPFDGEFEGLQRFEPISRTHPGFVSILHVGRNDPVGYFYCVMELGDKTDPGDSIQARRYRPRTLAHELNVRGQLPVEECLQVGLGLTAALGHLHEQGLVHRDVKPSNVVYVHGTPRLVDIGLVDTISKPKKVVGTNGYTPPEGPGTPAADLYSLGMVLYQVATGKSLHQYPDLPARLRDVSNAAQLLRLNEIILHATDLEARRRFPSAEEMHKALSSCLHLAQTEQTDLAQVGAFGESFSNQGPRSLGKGTLP